jgi:flagellar biosynthesis protein FlhA
MDGASKFVRGDAIAAIVITGVNLIGGLAVGMLQHHDSISVAGNTYSLLSVGDGLVSQIPALLMSLSTGIVVTRAASEDDLSTNLIAQLSRYRRGVRTTAVVMAALAIIPGLPKLPFLLVGGTLFLLGSRLPHDVVVEDSPEAQPEALPSPDTPAALAQQAAIMPLELELGTDLVDLVDRARGGDLLERVKALRRNVARELGVVIPPVHARDNERLPLAEYAIRIHGVEMARGSAPPGVLLAVGPGIEHLPGEETRDPAFGGPAKWISSELRYRAAVAGATVVDRSAVVTTHLSEVVRRHAGELLSRQDVRVLLDAMKQVHPAAIEEMTAAGLTLGAVQGVLRGLLEEQIPVRDLVRILEAITDQAGSSKDPDSLLEAARIALGPSIAAMHASGGVISALTLDPTLEQQLVASMQLGERGRFVVASPDELENLVASLETMAQASEAAGKHPVVVCSSRLRPALRRLLRSRLARLDVLGAAEISAHVLVETIGVVKRAPAPAL